MNPGNNPGGDPAVGSSPDAGLVSTFSMSNNFDFVYAGYFHLTDTTTFDEIIGYFDGNGPSSDPFDPDQPGIAYRMNIWSNVAGDLLPTFTGDFTGDVFSSDTTPGGFTHSDTGEVREFTSFGVNDPIFRLIYQPDQAITLGPGTYWFSHDVVIVSEPGTLALFGLGLLGLGFARRKLTA